MPVTPIDEALADVVAVLDRDGFTSEWEDTDAGLVFRVGAGTAECADCLVPKSVLELIVSNALAGTGRTLARVELPHLH